MLIKNARNNKNLKIMDPDCAICSQPAMAKCECEANGLTVAVRQAEQRMMASVYTEIRTWVRGHAQDYILNYFSVLTTRRKDEHASQIHRITERAAYYYNARPHPSETAAADAELKRGIDEDWRASVQRYPEVLEYFFSLVELTLPSDEEPGVRDPPLSALGGGGRKVRLSEPGPPQRGSTPAISDGGEERERRREQRRIGTPAGERERHVERQRRDSMRAEPRSRPMTAPPPPGGPHMPPAHMPPAHNPQRNSRGPPQYAPTPGYAYVNPY
ncbi:hypothetical protein SBOR_8485 [Sclerotinia borealis F-4128]|uniref:Serine/threonine protein phosphatase n=1 Tax=Sclerotinia borealis (strain F-4128) TaxID=1432307 RepID=W9C5G3_SCLBF|nr:hypothetical protein SBOR_8485 [Sclerotinia borealis F-4128]